jgi:hypothetical protein
MPKYRVMLKETVVYDVELEAESEQEAMESAPEIWADSEDPTRDFCGSGMGVEVESVELLEGEEETEDHRIVLVPIPRASFDDLIRAVDSSGVPDLEMIALQLKALRDGQTVS